MNSRLFLLSLLASSSLMAGECVISINQANSSVSVTTITERVNDEKACRDATIKAEEKHDKNWAFGVDASYKYTGSETVSNNSSSNEANYINSEIDKYGETIIQIISRNSVFLDVSGGGLCNSVSFQLVQGENNQGWDLKLKDKNNSIQENDKEKLIQIVEDIRGGISNSMIGQVKTTYTISGQRCGLYPTKWNMQVDTETELN